MTALLIVGVADVRIVRIAHAVKHIELVDADGCVLYAERWEGTLVRGLSGDKVHLDIYPVMCRAQDLRKLYGLWECER
jgi:hypothetical protein